MSTEQLQCWRDAAETNRLYHIRQRDYHEEQVDEHARRKSWHTLAALQLASEVEQLDARIAEQREQHLNTTHGGDNDPSRGSRANRTACD